MTAQYLAILAYLTAFVREIGANYVNSLRGV
jgi:hypothetical protein